MLVTVNNRTETINSIKMQTLNYPLEDLYCAGLQSNTIVYEIFNPVYSRIIASQRKFY
jgi:hypothetical protein